MVKPSSMGAIYTDTSAYRRNNRIDNAVNQLTDEMNAVKTSINQSNNNTITVNYDSNVIHKTYELKGPLTYSQIMNKLVNETGAPKKDIILYRENTKLVQNGSTAQTKFTDTNELHHDIQLSVKFRPIIGDHIHVLYSVVVYVDGEYKCLTPATGDDIGRSVHNHGDGKMHIHPFQNDTEDVDNSSGLGCTLKLWFHGIGCKYRIFDIKGETLPGLDFTKNVALIPLDDVTYNTNYTDIGPTTMGLKLDPTDEYQWVIYTWDTYGEYKANPEHPNYIYTNNFENIWLHNDTSVMVMGYVPKIYIHTIPPVVREKLELSINGHITWIENPENPDNQAS